MDSSGKEYLMHLIGQTIEHEQFGKGVVTFCDKGIITIDFSGNKKSFVYPDAFEAFLVPQDTGSQNEINGILVKRKMEEKQREIENMEHQKKIAHLRAMKIPSLGQAVFDLPLQKENDPFASLKCSTGTYLSGLSKGQPRIPDRIHFNTMCIFTRCPEGQPENTRQILGIAMVDENFQGEYCEDGWVPLKEDMLLTLQNPIAIWPYMDKEPKKAWGHTTFKYISNKIGEDILHDIRLQLTGSKDEKKAKAIYQYYCDCNHLSGR